MDTDTATALVRKNLLKADYSGEALTAADLLKEAGLDFNVEVLPIYDAEGNVSTTKFRQIVRDDIGEVLGTCKSRYTPIQTIDALQFLDNLVDDSGAKYEAAWLTTPGDAVGVTMLLPNDVKILGGKDAYDVYLLAKVPHNASGSVVFSAVPQRISCANQMVALQKGALQSFRVPHVKGAQAKLAQARKVFDVTFEYVDAFAKCVDRLAQDVVTEDWLRTALADVFKDNSDHVDLAFSNLKTSVTIPDEFRDTKYGFVNTVTETVQHMLMRNPKPDSFFGGRPAVTSKRAFDVCSA